MSAESLRGLILQEENGWGLLWRALRSCVAADIHWAAAISAPFFRDLGMAKQILKDEQLVNRERPTVPVLLGDEYAKGWRELTANELHGHRLTSLVNEGRLLPLDQQSLEHPADPKIAPIDQAKLGERVYQERVPGGRLVVKDVLGCDARDEPTAIPNLEPI